MKTDTPTITKLRQELRAAKEDATYWEQAHERERAERQKEIGMQEYRGNTISYIYDKCKNYGAHFDRMNLEIADLKARLAATPTTDAEENGELLEADRIEAAIKAGVECGMFPKMMFIDQGAELRKQMAIVLRAAKSNSPSAGAEGGNRP